MFPRPWFVVAIGGDLVAGLGEADEGRVVCVFSEDRNLQRRSRGVGVLVANRQSEVDDAGHVWPRVPATSGAAGETVDLPALLLDALRAVVDPWVAAGRAHCVPRTVPPAAHHLAWHRR